VQLLAENGKPSTKGSQNRRWLRFSKKDLGWFAFTYVIGFLIFRFDIRRHGLSFQPPETTRTAAIAGLVIAVLCTLYQKLRYRE
jgi:hypothetical protein